MARHLFFCRVLLRLSLGFIISTSTLLSECNENTDQVTYLEEYNSSWHPASGYGCDTKCSAYFGIEGLWWTICQDNLDYAVEFDSEDAEIILGPGETNFLDYNWCGGARGYLGFKGCGWNVLSCYTWYRNQSDDLAEAKKSNFYLKASLLHPDTNAEDAEKATIDSVIVYQTVDLLFGKDLCFCGGTMLLHPFFGVKAIKIEQDLKVIYEGGDFVIQTTSHFIGDEEAVPARVRWNSDLCAIGLNAGLNMDYRWYCGFGLYGSFNGSVLASRTDIRHKQETLDSDGKVDTIEIDLKENECVCVPGYQLTAGVSWDSWCFKCFYFVLKAGYEFNHWFNTPQLRRYHSGNEGISSDSSGNIGFHGATLRANLHF